MIFKNKPESYVDIVKEYEYDEEQLARLSLRFY